MSCYFGPLRTIGAHRAAPMMRAFPFTPDDPISETINDCIPDGNTKNAAFHKGHVCDRLPAENDLLPPA